MLIIIILSLVFTLPYEYVYEDTSFPSSHNPFSLFSLSDPIGGGEGYSRIVDPGIADYYVNDTEQFYIALEMLQSNQVIYIDDNAKIRMNYSMNTGDFSTWNWINRNNVTIASGRGRVLTDGSISKGAYLYNMDLEPKNGKLFLIYGSSKVRITGIRLRGGDPLARLNESLEDTGRQMGIFCYGCKDLEVDNCRISGFSSKAIYIYKGGFGYLHHNFINHNQIHGTGYANSIQQAFIVVEGNLFDYNRHHISATGDVGDGYVAFNNVILGRATNAYFESHSGFNRRDNTDIASENIIIYNNLFCQYPHEYPIHTDYSGNFPINIRGKPVFYAVGLHNWYETWHFSDISDWYIGTTWHYFRATIYGTIYLYSFHSHLFESYYFNDTKIGGVCDKFKKYAYDRELYVDNPYNDYSYDPLNL